MTRACASSENANQVFRCSERRILILNKAYDSTMTHFEPARRSARKIGLKKVPRYAVGRGDPDKQP